MKITNTNLTIQVADLDESISFYTSIGFTLKNRWGNHYVQIAAPGIVIGLHPNDKNKLQSSSGNLSIGLTTDDMKATREELLKLKIPFAERQEEGGTFIHFEDPDGTSLYFIQPKS